MTISEFLKAREQSPAAFANEIGVAPSTVTRWIRGERKPEASLLAKLNAVTGIPLHELRPDLWPAPPKTEEAA